jgi:hypothetical protein
MDRFDRPYCPPGGADPLEPEVAREVMTAGKRHRRRRHEPRTNPDLSARRQPRGRLLFRHRHSDPWHKALVQRRQGESHIALGSQRFDRFDPRAEGRHHGLFKRRRRNQLASRPDQAATRSHCQAAEQQDAADPSASERQRQASQPKLHRDERFPLPWSRHPQPGSDAGAKGGNEPQRQLRALAFQKAFNFQENCGNWLGQKASMRRFQRRVLCDRGARPVHRHHQTRGKIG